MLKAAEHETFKNAPIAEALLDIRASVPGQTDLGSLDAFGSAVAARFKERRKRQVTEGGFTISPTGELSQDEPTIQTAGYIYRNDARDKAVQARLDGFSFSKLKPYRGWDEFSREAKELWQIYLSVARPQRVSRLTLRYINRIEMPLPVQDFKDYVLTTLDIPEGVPQSVVTFFLEAVIPDDETKSFANVTSTFEQPQPGSSVIPYIFDIDAYQFVELDPSSEDIWRIFDEIRDYKNRIFFAP